MVKYPALKGEACNYQAKASCPRTGATKSGRLTAPLVARFLAALWSAWVVCPHRRQEKTA
jgi:hypothetical protein